MNAAWPKKKLTLAYILCCFNNLWFWLQMFLNFLLTHYCFILELYYFIDYFQLTGELLA
uniref:Methylthioribose kinase-like n=1 Tax=Rhizophora mucronata TaxID=61149 RepID=A0A2P2JL75_RHIMU